MKDMDPTTPNTVITAIAAGQRVGDLERQIVCDQLAAHFSAGRLDPEELDQRIDIAMRARTAGDLHPLLCDLPGLAPAPVRAGPAVAHGSLAMAVFVATGLVLLMLGGSVLMSPVVTVFSLIGGSLAAFVGAGGTYLVMRARQREQRSRSCRIARQLSRPECGPAAAPPDR